MMHNYHTWLFLAMRLMTNRDAQPQEVQQRIVASAETSASVGMAYAYHEQLGFVQD